MVIVGNQWKKVHFSPKGEEALHPRVGTAMHLKEELQCKRGKTAMHTRGDTAMHSKEL